MLNFNQISEAFLNFVDKQQNNESIVYDLVKFNQLYKKNNSLKSVLLSKRINKNQKEIVLMNSLDSIINKSVIAFIIYLSEHNTIKHLSKISSLIESKHKLRQGVIDVDLISAVKVDAKVIDSISDFVKKNHSKEAIINEKIDKNLIAGLKLKIGNTILDGSIRNKLQKLKNNLTNNIN
tara:strand:+ start:872 stop:1408 length:537 start_codon:yes stop_codon:yes gene_type:complete